MGNRRVRRATPWIWLVFLVAGCQSSRSATLPDPTVSVSLTGQPTSFPVVQPTRTPAIAVQPSPTVAVASATATPIQRTAVQGTAIFSLTILHTGQVYGETAPCSG